MIQGGDFTHGTGTGGKNSFILSFVHQQGKIIHLVFLNKLRYKIATKVCRKMYDFLCIVSRYCDHAFYKSSLKNIKIKSILSTLQFSLPYVNDYETFPAFRSEFVGLSSKISFSEKLR